VVVSPTSLTVTQYQTATFHCSADGNPKPSVSWNKVSGTGQKDVLSNKLQIRSAGFNDSGSYVCKATNVLGKAMKVVKLFVEGKMLGKEKKTKTTTTTTKTRTVIDTESCQKNRQLMSFNFTCPI